MIQSCFLWKSYRLIARGGSYAETFASRPAIHIGGRPGPVLKISRIPGVEGIWQGHLSLLDPDPTHNTSPEMIANLEETVDCKGNWIKAIGRLRRQVYGDYRFTVTNGRNGFSKSYVSR